ncbi:TPA: helix-turn-helix transcriptional regulator [Streptococcus pyogenes]|nr:helix-turn-helix transcriptional regulator [Streptococcus pyogenes]HEP1969216.1 helix-turn-helix transcriptional regulator [Streptococcus pyogenes]HEP2070586.1 helix-turn-helix transcriptional regulator [Streptococcus pyogenes]HEP2409600.1 helix-turn-helix transcriptional regulator [Streptococcus pyogenes]HEQ4502064.1 helix-turn-helix transcriptional regulator [Streptococcus pyogenes]
MFSGHQLKTARLSKGITQSELGGLLHVNKMTISNWEKGKNIPNEKHLNALLHLFNVTSDYFDPNYKLLTPYNQLTISNKEKVIGYSERLLNHQMEPTYLNGEVVLIKQNSFDYDGAIYAVEWDGQTYIKKVFREDEGLRLVSLNKKYSDKFAPYSEEPRIIGKIIANFRPLEI